MSPIETAIKNLSRKRLIMMAANLLYFLALLIAGVALFLVGIGPLGYMVAGILLAVYLLLVRPLNRRIYWVCPWGHLDLCCLRLLGPI